MTSEEQPTGTSAAVPHLPEAAPAGTHGERARALLRLRPYRRLWTAQLVGGTGDRLGLLVLIALTWAAAVAGGPFGHGYRAQALAVAAVFGVRMLATLLFGAVLLGPLHNLLAGKLDRRWVLFGADAFRAVLIGVAPWWLAWSPGSATYLLLGTVFLTGAAERVWAITKAAAVPSLLPPADPGAAPSEQRPSAAVLDTVRTLDLRTGWATVPLAATALVGLTLVNNIFAALGSHWLRANQATTAGVGAALLLAASAVLLYLQELPAGTAAAPRSPLQGLRAPTDATPGPALRKGRTGSAPYFTFSVAAAYASMAGVAALGLLTAVDHRAGPIGYGLLVLAAAGAPALGVRLTRATLPSLSRRRLLALALLTEGVALILAGLVLDFVLVLLLTSLAGLAAGIVIATGRTLLAQEVEEIRLPKVTEHLYAVLRAVVAAALIVVPLIAAGYGEVAYGEIRPGNFTFIHDGAALAIATAGLLTMALAAVVLLKTDDQRGSVPLGRELVQSLRGGAPLAPHRVSGTGFFIALEGGDGAGKSTQANALAEWIRSKGHEVVLTREPGGSPIGQRLRALVLDVGNTGLSHRAEALIYAADRAEHVENVIRPALERGAVVITDRYMDSSIAYQGAGRDLAATEVARISRWATGGLVPDLTVVLDVDPTKARERFTEALDRLESEPTEFHTRVRSGFLALAAADPARYLVVDGSQQPAFVTTAIRHRLDRELPLSTQEKAAQAEQERLAREEAARRAAEEARKKAEEEAAERKRQELLEQLRAEQAEKERQAELEAERIAAEEARKAAAEAKLKAEAEARRRAEEEAVRQAEAAARQKAEQAERERLAAEAAAQAELQRQRDLQRAEQRRRAEEALQRAEEARLAAEAAAAAASVSSSASVEGPTVTATVELPQVGGTEEATQEISERERQAAVRAAEAVKAGAADETAVLPAVPAADETAVLSAVPAADETAVLPTVPAADETAVLPRVEPSAPGQPGLRSGGVAAPRTSWARPGGRDQAETTTSKSPRLVDDRVPPGLWRGEKQPAGQDAQSPSETTRELPAVEQRPRPAWAEETPMDDLPSLTDTLLGSREEWAKRETQDHPQPPSPQEPELQEPQAGRGKGRRWRGGRD
ncbi:dTMP kinase [Kitasatospora sp. GP82]|uniref:dTMP kinase n=1 Tax=Kitasatospora sp. GP82 TaxID=3035089 RepID=UPI002474EEC8|nr:dTMP kinase [Kitasatospora sp. GP82]MDH6124556.1 dTMP kinase [Kitasatospora sp. GP82]